MIRLSLVTLTIVVLLAVAFWFGQRSTIYHPSQSVPTPAEFGAPGAELVQFDTADGLRLSGWLFQPVAADATRAHTVIVFNGNAGHRGYRAGLANALAARGLRAFIFDYRGYGGNPGTPTEEGLALDARAALAFVRSRKDVDPARLVYFGESLGGGVAVRLAIEAPPARLVLRSAFSSIAAMAAHHFRYLPIRWLLRESYDSLAAMPSLKSPVLVIVGTNDTIVPASDTQKLFDAAPEPKRLVTIQGADHNDLSLAEGQDVIDAVVTFIDGR